MITLAPAKFVTNAVVKQRGTAKNGTGRFTSGPDGLLARMVGFKGAGSMYAHRYNGQPDGTSCTPPASGGKMHTYTIPVTAVYVVWSFQTPIAWVDADGTVTIPPLRYSVTTTQHQGQCRTWLGYDVPGTSRHAERSLPLTTY